MKHAAFFAAAGIVLIANTFALTHAWKNRSGPPDAEVTLTQRELALTWNSPDDDSGVTLNLTWVGTQSSSPSWLDADKLRALGFDTTVSPAAAVADEYYQRQRARRAYVALEYDGPAWQAWSDSLEPQALQHPEMSSGIRNRRRLSSRLIAIDAATDPNRLRASHTDRSSVIIVPAVIQIRLDAVNGVPLADRPPPRLEGWIEDIPSSIHVPLPFSEGFRHLIRGGAAPYRVRLRYGAEYEPWVVGVEMLPPATARP